LSVGGNWADDVEASVGEKSREHTKAASEYNSSSQPKESAVERAKSEDKNQNAGSGVSSPDLIASSSTTAKDDDASSVPTNVSSETTWETKSQSSEPAWIVERKERQSSSQNSDNTVRGEKKSKESPLPQPSLPTALQEAAPPTVNIWLQRAEAAKVKAATQQTAVSSPVPAPKSASVSPRPNTPASTENQRPQTDSAQKAGSTSGPPRRGESLSGAAGDFRRPGSFHGKRADDVRGDTLRGAKPITADMPPGDTVKSTTRTSNLPKASPLPPPSVKDEDFWPTPNLAQETERKESPEKDEQAKHGVDAAQNNNNINKPRKKRSEWESMVVTPNIIWETQNIRPSGGERGGRGGPRQRGGFRGGANGSHGDRQNGRASSEDDTIAAPVRGPRHGTADRDTVPPPPKPNRAASDNLRREQNAESRGDRGARGSDSHTENRVAGIDQTPFKQQEAGSATSYAGIPRTSSPIDARARPDAQDEERMPDPVPGRSSVGTQTVQEGDASKRAANEPPIRLVPSEGRKDGRDATWNGPPRGGKRGGRGRGGSREYANNHQANPTYGNGDSTAASFHANAALSPSAYQPTRGNHQFQYPQSGRGGWGRGNPRSQSIPLDSFYSRYGGPYAQPQLPSMQSYVPGMYESAYGGYPMSAMPYQPYMEQGWLLEMVASQLEYYFSLENLLKDMFLRKHMDSQGFVFLDVVAGFNRIKQINAERALLKTACIHSENIEIRVGDDGKERLRKRDGWEQFLLPMDQRTQSAQTDGPQSLQRPELPQFQPTFGASSFRGPASATNSVMPQRLDRRSHDGGHARMNGNAAQFAGLPAAPDAAYTEVMYGEDMRGRATKSPMRDNDVYCTQQQMTDGRTDGIAESDAFPDDQAAVLTVVVKLNRQKVSHHHAVTRTFSNGSIDSRSALGELEKPAESQPAPTVNGITFTNGDVSPSAARQPSPSSARLPEPAGSADISVYWVKEPNGGSSEGVPAGLTPEPYLQLRYKALDQRHHAATGTCPYDLNVLYQFWSHFLIRNFNSRMYAEFKYYANEDAKTRLNSSGLQNLIKFYAQALLSHNPIRDLLVKDYVELVQNEPTKLEGAAFKQLRSAWRNGALNLKNRKKLSDLVDGPLKERLES